MACKLTQIDADSRKIRQTISGEIRRAVPNTNVLLFVVFRRAAYDLRMHTREAFSTMVSIEKVRVPAPLKTAINRHAHAHGVAEAARLRDDLLGRVKKAIADGTGVPDLAVLIGPATTTTTDRSKAEG